jgi:hypothetical protein
MYVRNEEKNRDITIVSDLIEENGNYFIKCAWAFRHRTDKFIKREGRKLALERLNSADEKFSTKFQLDPERVRFFNIAAEILSNILSKENTPKRFIKDILWDMDFFNYLSLSPQERNEYHKSMWSNVLDNVK